MRIEQLKKTEIDALIDIANKSESFDAFVDNVGYDSWMDRVLEAAGMPIEEGEALTEQQEAEINDILDSIYNKTSVSRKIKNSEIKFRISDADKEAIKNKASKNNMTMSEYILFLIRKDIH